MAGPYRRARRALTTVTEPPSSATRSSPRRRREGDSRSPRSKPWFREKGGRMNDQEDVRIDEAKGLSRRDLVVRGGVAGAGVLTLPALLAACGGDDEEA